MKKLITLILCLICTISLVGCSSGGSTIAWNNGTIENKGKSFTIDEFCGSSATQDIGNVKYSYSLCPDIDSRSDDDLGIAVEDMTKFKKGYYYTAYLNSQIWVFYPIKEGYEQCHITVDEGDVVVEQVVDTAYNMMADLGLRDDITTVNINNTLDLNVEIYTFKARAGEVIIPEVIRVKPDDGSVTMTENVNIGETSVGKMSTGKYDYYQYNGLLIQVTAGTDPSTLVTLK